MVRCVAMRWSLRTTKLLRRIGSSTTTHHRPLSLDIQDLESCKVGKVNSSLGRGLPVVHHHDYTCEFPKNHRFIMDKFRGVWRFLIRDQVVTEKQAVAPRPLSEQHAKLVHSSVYIDEFFSGTLSTNAQRRSGFQWSEGIVNRCRLEAGGTVLAADLCLQTGLVCNTGGGTHHAFPSYASGFCMLNDLAIASQYLLNTGKANKVLIIDCDVHQGDGTSFIFQNEPRVFTLDFHCTKNFPFRKQKSDRGVGLREGLEDDEYLAIVRDHVTEVMQEERPDVILYDAGIDPHREDELGKLNLSDQGLFLRDYFVLDTAWRSGIPVCTVIGGGYHTNHDLVALRHTIIHRAATKVWNERNS